MRGLKKIAVPRQRLAELVYDQIRSGMESGEISPDDKLHQERLAELLNVSRTPVREALLRLEQEGLLESSASGGFLIRRISEIDVRDIYQARQAIEGFSIGFLAQRNDPATLEHLKKIVSQQEATTAESSQAYYEANRIIHRAFVQSTGNGYLLESFDALWNRSLSLQIFQTMNKSLMAASLEGHMSLCDAISSGSFQKAQAAMHSHISDGCALQLKAI